MHLHLTVWDVALFIAVSVMGGALAYLHHPQWKAALLMLPIPFTTAFLSIGNPVDVTNVAGLLVLLAFVHAVRYLYYSLNVRIMLTIVICAVGYALTSMLLARVLPRTEWLFWILIIAAFVTGLLFYLYQPIHGDRGHRTLLPVWVKLPIIFVIVFSLVLLKQSLQGFMTVFPMVTMIASYEARFSLWTNCHKIALGLIAMAPMMAGMHIAQVWLGWPPSLALVVGWVVLLSILLPLSRELWSLPLQEAPSHAPNESTSAP